MLCRGLAALDMPGGGGGATVPEGVAEVIADSDRDRREGQTDGSSDGRSLRKALAVQVVSTLFSVAADCSMSSDKNIRSSPISARTDEKLCPVEKDQDETDREPLVCRGVDFLRSFLAI
ncbi:hypothetical protein Q1695_008711 [Nippostrongylus brasiliensis]|nr:hypothetical protein Q1695_008711 [Nippostrongylus brasiliensis]